MTNISGRYICIVAIVKNEERFLDEWLVYHKLLGIDHFFLYNDDQISIDNFLKPHADYVTVINWADQHDNLEGRNRQTKAYLDAVKKHAAPFEWVAFIDIDEFIVLREDEGIESYLNRFTDASAVSLNWHVFGHNGYYDDPPGLITASLNRRMLAPSKQVKTINKTATILDITSAHACRLKDGVLRVDGNGNNFTYDVYPDRTRLAHINHYQCRSFLRWMSRVKRGAVSIDGEQDHNPKNLWRTDEDLCLRQFVTTVALNKNEHVDDFMSKFKDDILEQLSLLK